MSKKYQLKVGKIGQKVISAYKGVEGKFCDTFLENDQFSERGYILKASATAEKVVGVYQKIEHSVVGGYKKIEGKFVNAFLEQLES